MLAFVLKLGRGFELPPSHSRRTIGHGWTLFLTRRTRASQLFGLDSPGLARLFPLFF